MVMYIIVGHFPRTFSFVCFPWTPNEEVWLHNCTRCTRQQTDMACRHSGHHLTRVVSGYCSSGYSKGKQFPVDLAMTRQTEALLKSSLWYSDSKLCPIS